MIGLFFGHRTAQLESTIKTKIETYYAVSEEGEGARYVWVVPG
jgi:hypothetical protein